MGCHEFIPGQQTILMGMKQYQDAQEQLLPNRRPKARVVDPEWLRKFLSNPALSTTDTNRNGVRPDLKVRMPTSSFSYNELRKLVRSSRTCRQQLLPYIPEQVLMYFKRSDGAETCSRGRRLTPPKRHATGDPRTTRSQPLPTSPAKERLKLDWLERWITDCRPSSGPRRHSGWSSS